MALPTTLIYLQSPYFVSEERANLERIKVELYVYTGTLTTDKPSTPQYILFSDAFPNSSGDYYAEIDIAKFACDFVEVTYSGSSTSSAVWLEWNLYYADYGDTAFTLEGSYKATGLDGYGYFEEGNNPTPVQRALISSDYVVKPRNYPLEIPVLQDKLIKYQLAKGGALLYSSGTLSTTENTANVVYYANTQNAPTADRMLLTFDGLNPQVINIRYNDECKNVPILVTFVNRYGALQDMYFFGRNKKVMDTTSERYKRNLREDGTYSKYRHQDTVMSKNGKDVISLSSGFYPESSNVTFQELLLSNQVWVTINPNKIDGAQFEARTDEVYPVNVRTSQMTYKTSQYDKLINYDIEFEIANDKKNTVR